MSQRGLLNNCFGEPF